MISAKRLEIIRRTHSSTWLEPDKEFYDTLSAALKVVTVVKAFEKTLHRNWSSPEWLKVREALAPFTERGESLMASSDYVLCANCHTKQVYNPESEAEIYCAICFKQALAVVEAAKAHLKNEHEYSPKDLREALTPFSPREGNDEEKE